MYRPASIENRRKGSGMLLTLLLTLLGAVIFGLGIDAVSLVCAKLSVQNAADLAADAAAVELRLHPSASPGELRSAATASATRNTPKLLAADQTVTLEGTPGAWTIVTNRQADISFLRMFHPEPFHIVARAKVSP